jgi:hypothetical protein
MAVDTLAFCSRGVYDSAGTSQTVVNARFASYGLLGAGGTPSAVSVGEFPTFPTMCALPTMLRRRSYLCGVALIILTKWIDSINVG